MKPNRLMSGYYLIVTKPIISSPGVPDQIESGVTVAGKFILENFLSILLNILLMPFL